MTPKSWRTHLLASLPAFVAFIVSGQANAAATGDCFGQVQTSLINQTRHVIEAGKPSSNAPTGISFVSTLPDKLGPASAAAPPRKDGVLKLAATMRSWVVSYSEYSRDSKDDTPATVEFIIKNPDEKKQYNFKLEYRRGQEASWNGDAKAIVKAVIGIGVSVSTGNAPAGLLNAIDLLNNTAGKISFSRPKYLAVVGEYLVDGKPVVGYGGLENEIDNSAINAVRLGDIAVIAASVPSNCPSAGWIVSVVPYEIYKNGDIPYR